ASIDGRAAELDPAGDHLVAELARHTLVDRVDDAADGIGTVTESRRPAEHLDLLDDEGIDRHGVVVARPRRVERDQPILEYADAGAGEAADDGTARARPEVRGA